MPSTIPGDVHARASEGQLAGSRADARSPTQALHVTAHPGLELPRPRADPVDQADRRTSSVLEVPITWLDLTPPEASLHLKVMEAGDGHRVDIWSSRMSPEEQMAWASSQGAWTVRGAYDAGSFVVSFTADAVPEDLAWLARLSSYQRLDLHPDGEVQLHLSGPWLHLLEVHRCLHQTTDARLVRVVDGEEGGMPDPGPRSVPSPASAWR